MGIDIYTPDPNKNIIHKTMVDFKKRIIPCIVHIVQYDSIIPIIEVSLYSNGDTYHIPEEENIEMKVRWGKKDGNTCVYKNILGCNNDRSRVYFNIDIEMSNDYGIFNPILELVYTNDVSLGLGSSKMIFNIDKNPIQN